MFPPSHIHQLHEYEFEHGVLYVCPPYVVQVKIRFEKNCHLLQVLQLLSGADYISTFATNQLQTQVMLALDSFYFGWDLGLIIFGSHLLLLGYLMLKAGYMRKILGILLILASLGYLLDGFGKLFSSNYDISIAMFTFIGEVILIFWLLIKGRKIKEAI